MSDDSSQPELKDWKGLGLFAEKRQVEVSLSVEAVLESQSESRGGSLPFKALASDDKVYWIKMVNTNQGGRMPATEQIVSACGRLIGAPVCETSLIVIPDVLDGDELDNGTVMLAGIAHASLDIANCTFDKYSEPQYRLRDDNRKRHAGYYALYDWCWGEDMQWLYDVTADWQTYSHDHGHFLPGGPDWTVANLEENVDIAREIDPEAANLDDNELVRIADRLDSIGRSELVQVLAGIPKEWPVEDTELETVGWFLEKRCSQVADRLRTLANRNSQQT